MKIIQYLIYFFVCVSPIATQAQKDTLHRSINSELLIINIVGGYTEWQYTLNEYYVRCFKGQFFTPVVKSIVWVGAQYVYMDSKDFFQEKQSHYLLGPVVRYRYNLNNNNKYFMNVDASMNYGTTYLDLDENLSVKEGIIIGLGSSFDWRLNSFLSITMGLNLTIQTLKGGQGVFGFPYLGISFQ